MSSIHVKHLMHRFLKQALWEEVERVPCDAWHLGAQSSRKSLEGEDPLPEQAKPGQGSREGHRGSLGMADSRQ